MGARVRSMLCTCSNVTEPPLRVNLSGCLYVSEIPIQKIAKQGTMDKNKHYAPLMHKAHETTWYFYFVGLSIWVMPSAQTQYVKVVGNNMIARAWAIVA